MGEDGPGRRAEGAGLTQQPHGPLRSFGRIKGRPIKPRQAGLLDTLLPKLALDVSAPLDPWALMPGASETWLEIGFGGGEHLAEQAARRPDVLLLGAEPFLNGAASALRHLDQRGLGNVRLHVGDARDLLAALPDGALERVFILFPDPWPKGRHHKRRLIQSAFVTEVARVLKPGGALRLATDWADYADWTLERAGAEPRLRWTAERACDWRIAPADHVATRYEQKQLGDIAPIFLEFVRTAETLISPIEDGGVPAKRGRGPAGAAGRNVGGSVFRAARGPSTIFDGPPPRAPRREDEARAACVRPPSTHVPTP